MHTLSGLSSKNVTLSTTVIKPMSSGTPMFKSAQDYPRRITQGVKKVINVEIMLMDFLMGAH